MRRSARPAIAAVAGVHLGDFDMGLGQFIEKARGQCRLPQPVDAAVGDEPDVAMALGAGEADIGETALFLEAGAAALVERALVREQALLPAGQEHGFEFQPLGRVQRHDRDGVEIGVVVGVHDQRHVLEEGAHGFETGNGLDQFLQVLEPGRRVGGAVVLPHLGVAGFLKDGFGELVAGRRFQHALPAGEHLDHVGQRLARLGLQLIGEDEFARGGEHRDAAGAGDVVDLAHRRFAQAALGRH
jgi:hypothetical protein